jgi:hypothetical protein
MYENIIEKLFKKNTPENTHLLFYLKCDDPGPKKQIGWNFSYPIIDKEKLSKKLLSLSKEYPKVTFHINLLETNEIEDNKLLNQVKDRSKYIQFFEDDEKLVRSMHCNYNLEQVNKLVKKIEKYKKIVFDYYIYVRPDLFFTSPSKNISEFPADKIILGFLHENSIADHISIIPKKYAREFFNGIMNIFRTNDTTLYRYNEEIYMKHIEGKYVGSFIGGYYIKRCSI